MTRRRTILSLCLLSALPPLAGCVRRTLYVNSEPSGALVYVNGQEVGRTPLERDFTWYGVYDVEIRKEGFETVKRREPVIAPAWQWVPIDLFAELLPLHDKQRRSYTLAPSSTQPVDAQVMFERASTLEGKLESSEFTRAAPATRPSP